MKHERIDDRAKVWTVTLGPDGHLQEELDPELLAQLDAAQTAEDVEKLLGEVVARTRSW